MSLTLLLAETGASGAARAVPLDLKVLETSPGGEDITVSFRPNRSDDLHAGAKVGAQLAYRILFREGIVRSQLAVSCQVALAPVNVKGRSAELGFALAILLEFYAERNRHAEAGHGWPPVAVTGVLDADGTVHAVEHVVAKLRAALAYLGPGATVFYPSENRAEVEQAALRTQRSDVELVPIGHLDEALEHLGIVLERVYLRNPFRGLEHFDYEHHSIFFGRDGEVRELVQQLLRGEAAGRPGVLVEGPSGSGKSSFLRAGVLPALVNPRDQPQALREALAARPVSAGVRRTIWRPGLILSGVDESTLVRSIRDCWSAYSEWNLAWKRERIETLSELALARRAYWPGNVRFVWMVDQLEEIFALGIPNEPLGALGSFLRQLQVDCVWTLACIRADATPQLKAHETFRSVFGPENQYYLPTLSGVALDEVIELPAKAAGLRFGSSPDGKRVNQLLRDEAYREQDSLPLLQFTLNALYLRRSSDELTHVVYTELGGLLGSIATTAEAIFRELATASDRPLARAFRALVSVDDSGRATRRYAPITEISGEPLQKTLVSSLVASAERQALERLVNARLCVTDQREGSAVVAFAHETLLRTWPRLRDWVTQEGALLQARDVLIAEARRWVHHGKRRDWLVTASDRLASIRSVIEADIPLPEIARQFAEQSTTRAKRATRLRGLALLSIAALAVIAVAFGLYAQHAGSVASAQRDATLQAQRRSLTQTAAARLNNADVAAASGIVLEVLAGRSGTRQYTADAVSVFQESRAADRQLLAITGHAGGVSSVAFSPDDLRLVTASNDNTVRIWDATSGQPLLVLNGHTDNVDTAAFSPDGRRIVTASYDKTARIWDAVSGQPLLVLRGHAERVRCAEFSPDGRRIVTASYDKTARIWDAVSGQPLLVLSGHTDRVKSAAFSPDGRRIVTASNDRTARVWDAASGRQQLMLNGHTDVVQHAAFSPDGRRIVTASLDKTARVWDAASAQPLLVLSGHTQWLEGAAFSPDGRRIVTASNDKTARVWDAASGRQLLVLNGHTDVVPHAAFSPDGRRVATASLDKTARVWDLDSGQPVLVLNRHTYPVVNAAFSPNGQRVVTASVDKTARVWDAVSGQPLLVLSGHTDQVVDAAFSPDGRRVVTASVDKTARIWDALTGQPVLVLSGHKASLNSSAFSPDGQRIVTASNDKTARTWDAVSGRPLLVLTGHTDEVSNAAFSPDGRRIVTASYDKTARTWDADTGRPLLVLSGHTDAVSAAFSPDGRDIVTASGDKTARIWDAVSGQPLLVLRGHTDAVSTAAFSPDGRRVVTASTDKTARIWDAMSGQPLLVLRGHTEAVLNAALSPDGRRVITTSFDNTARIWDARVAPLDAQVAWMEAAQFDPLSSTERFQLGLPVPTDVHSWTAKPSKCDQSAGAPYDPLRRAPGVTLDEIVANIAVPACAEGKEGSNGTAHSIYQHGRALMAKGDFSAAKRDLERAGAAGYTAASIDLGMLLSQPSSGVLNVPRTISLYEQAWKDGVTIAAFELGILYEHGVRGTGNNASYVFAPNETRALSWFQKGAEAGDPNALARFAEKEDRAVLTAGSSTGRTGHLLKAFEYYASAAERARLEDWPDAAWKDWRYRRASIARVLAREGMMEQVADEYAAVRKQYAPKPTTWQRLKAVITRD